MQTKYFSTKVIVFIFDEKLRTDFCERGNFIMEHFTKEIMEKAERMGGEMKGLAQDMGNEMKGMGELIKEKAGRIGEEIKKKFIG